MTLEERVTAQIVGNERLRGVPAPVIEEVLRQGLAWLSEHVPAEAFAWALTETDWAACEVCRTLIDPWIEDGHLVDSEGIYLCNPCSIDGGPDVQAVALVPPSGAESSR